MTRAEEQLAFFYELGLAISQWAFVERAIYQIIATCTEPQDHDALGFAFFAIDNFRAKLAFSDAIIKSTIRNKSHLAEWSGLTNRLGKTVTKRNRLAHDRVFDYAQASPGRRLALEDWPSDKPRRSPILKPPTGALCVRDVIACKQDFVRLALDLKNLRATLLGQKMPHPEVRERAGGPPTIRAIRSQMYEELELQRKPSRK